MGRPIPTTKRSDKKKVELPYHPPGHTPPGPVRAVIHVHAMHMVIPSLHTVFVNPSVRIRGGFKSLSRDEFMDVFKGDTEPYLVTSVSNQHRRSTVIRMVIHLSNNWEGTNMIHMFAAGTD